MFRVAEVRITYKEEIKTSVKKVSNSKAAAIIAKTVLGDVINDRELFGILCLNSGNEPISYIPFSVGATSSCPVDTRLLLRDLLVSGAAGFIVFHNHPSGEARPSAEDRDLTEKIFRASETVGLKMLDHVVLTDRDHYSFADSGLIPRTFAA